MKIAITAMGQDLDDPMDPHFGRAKGFLLVDTETGAATAHDNTQNLQAAQGAGIQAAQAVARLGAEALISGNVGPKAFRALSAAGIKIFLAKAGSVREAVEQFKAGELPETTEANVEGHWV